MPKAPAAHAAFPEVEVFVLAVLASGLAQIAVGAMCQHVFKHLSFGRRALIEMTTNKAFRRASSPGMAYVNGGAPFVDALLFCVAYWLLDCKPPGTRPMLVSVVLWVTGRFHGSIVDYAAVKYSFDVAFYRMVTTLVNAIAMAWVVEWVYDKHHWD